MNFFIAKAFAAAITINPNLPGPAATTFEGEVKNFYTFALLMAGILAFGAIVYGGIRYAAGRGNPSSESEGKSWITNALLGLLLLAGAYIILSTINPNILNLTLPTLPTLSAVDNGANACGKCGGTCNGPCDSYYQTCQALTNGTYQCEGGLPTP